MRILIVEDKDYMRALLRAVLAAEGLKEICEAPDGGTGLVRLQQRRFDLILTDLVMQPMDGIEFTRRARAIDADLKDYTPIIVMSGYSQRDRLEEVRNAGADIVLVKPVPAIKLIVTIRSLLEKPRRSDPYGAYSGPNSPHASTIEKSNVEDFDAHVVTPTKKLD